MYYKWPLASVLSDGSLRTLIGWFAAISIISKRDMMSSFSNASGGIGNGNVHQGPVLKKAFVKMDEEYTETRIKEALLSFSNGADGSKFQWQLIEDYSDAHNADLLWTEYEEIDWMRLLNTNTNTGRPSNSVDGRGSRDGGGRSQIVCSYCIRKGLIRKSQNALVLEMYRCKRPMNNLQTPLTVLFQLDCLDYLDEAMNEAFEVRDGLARNEQLLLQSSSSSAAASTAVHLNSDESETVNTYSNVVVEEEDVEDEENELKVFMMKPSICNRASGLFVFRTQSEFDAILRDIYKDEDNTDEDDDQEEEEEEEEGEDFNYYNSSSGGRDRSGSGAEDGLDNVREWVIQEFIDTPLLINDRKFHIRAYVLCTGQMQVYLFDQMLALFALKPYKHLSNIENSFDQLSHITNTCIQVSHPDFSEDSSVQCFWDIVGRGEMIDMKVSVFQQICRIVHDLFDAVLHSPTQFQPLRNAFEIYGLDFLVDEESNVFFLEANAYPGIYSLFGIYSNLD
jgi:tubulin---tyrosine ligase